MGGSTVSAIRRLFEALDARLQLAPQWRGAELERLLDHEHARVVALLARRLEVRGWDVHIEVTYSEYGERGSIDVLGLLPAARAALIAEVKTDVASGEAIGRKLDEKARLAPTIVERRFGWTPVAVARVLVMPEAPRLRRHIIDSAVLSRILPIASRAVDAWLRRPSGVLAATWFLSGISLGNPRRVRRPRRGVEMACRTRMKAR